ncbi:MAG: phosphotransferase [Acidobacteria bacterium]|nr:phosphotransferase [Acidobacteriota bacterium]
MRQRVEALVGEWNVTVQDTAETESSFLVFGTCRDQPVVLKVVKRPGDEWHSGEVLQAFGGNGVVRVYEYVEGAVLVERAIPGESIVSMTIDGRDGEATTILADVIQRMSGCTPQRRCPTVHDWAKGFDRYLASDGDQIPRELVVHGHELYVQLAASQGQTTLLHGDLHHYNVLNDARRGWLAIDPKGVIGDVEYEIGAILRNPIERPDLFASPDTIDGRLQRLAGALRVDGERVLQWAFAQAVLSAIWAVEDGFAVQPDNPTVALAHTLRAMLT